MLLTRPHADHIELPKEDIQRDLDVAGMVWWNSLSETDRRYWCLAAMTVVPADAWKYFRLVTAPRSSVKVSADE